MLSLDSSIIIDNNSDLMSYEKINSSNVQIFKQQNSLLFPVTYPDSFYRNIVASPGTIAFLVFRNNHCIGSVSLRLEPLSRWNEIRVGNTVDNFNPIPSTENEGDKKIYYIMTLGVLAAFRHLGYGAEILEKIISDSRNNGIDCIGLHVHVENHTALRFYDRRGFKILGKVDNYYKKITPNSAYILELKLI